MNKKSKSKSRILNRGISELVRRATIGALFPHGPVTNRHLQDLPSIKELLDESDDETETEIDSETESDTPLPTIEVKVPTDGTIRDVEEFISSYEQALEPKTGKSFLLA